MRIRRSKIALLSLCVVVAILLFAILAPVLSAMSGNDPYTSNTSPEVLDDFETPGLPLPGYMYPSAQHWLGVEPGLGRDLFARLAYGGQVSLTIALLSTVVSVVLGTVLGAAAGYFGGKTDAIISRIMDLFLAFPHLLLVLSLTPILQSRLRDTPLGEGSFLPMASLVIILGFFGWAYLARIVRGQVLSLREREFVEAARSFGASHLSISVPPDHPQRHGSRPGIRHHADPHQHLGGGRPLLPGRRRQGPHTVVGPDAQRRPVRQLVSQRSVVPRGPRHHAHRHRPGLQPSGRRRPGCPGPQVLPLANFALNLIPRIAFHPHKEHHEEPLQELWHFRC